MQSDHYHRASSEFDHGFRSEGGQLSAGAEGGTYDEQAVNEKEFRK